MRQDPVYQKFKEAILVSDKTPQQVRDMSIADVKVMCPGAKEAKKSAEFIMSMRRSAAMAKQTQIDNALIKSIEGKLSVAEKDFINPRVRGLTLKGGSIGAVSAGGLEI